MVAPEHIRGLALDENCSLKPILREGLEQLRSAARSNDYVDLSGEQIPQYELDNALQQSVGNDPDGMMPEGGADVPVIEQPTEPAEPLRELAPEPMVADPAEVDDSIEK